LSGSSISRIGIGFELRHGEYRVAREVLFRIRDEEAVAHQFLQGRRNLFIRAIFQGVSEVAAVDLAVPEVGAEARVEDTRGGGERERPHLRLVPEVAYPNSVLGARRARVPEERDLRELH
jgi:hypothetical protein